MRDASYLHSMWTKFILLKITDSPHVFYKVLWDVPDVILLNMCTQGVQYYLFYMSMSCPPIDPISIVAAYSMERAGMQISGLGYKPNWRSGKELRINPSLSGISSRALNSAWNYKNSFTFLQLYNCTFLPLDNLSGPLSECNLPPEMLGFEGWGGLFIVTYCLPWTLPRGSWDKSIKHGNTLPVSGQKNATISAFQTFHPLWDSSKTNL